MSVFPRFKRPAVWLASVCRRTRRRRLFRKLNKEIKALADAKIQSRLTDWRNGTCRLAYDLES